MGDDNTDDNDWGIDRRTILKNAGIAGGIGLVGTSELSGSVAAGPGNGGGKPCHKDFECSDDGTYVKIEFVIERDDDGNITDCYFEEETDTGLVEVTYWEDKEGNVGSGDPGAPEESECEPVYVEWEAAGYVVNKALAFGGNDCDGTDEDDGETNGFNLEEGSYRSQLENNGGKTAAISNLQFCVEELETVELPVEDVYIGYEDRPASGDFDYNDFGMDANITETYLGGELQTIELKFTSKVYKAGDDHLIHIQRDVPDDVKWEYTLSRSGTGDVVTGDVTSTGFGSGSGDLDLVLFDTGPLSNGDSTDATVTATVEITSGSVSQPTSSPRPDEAANNPLFEAYDPYMDNTSQGNIINLETVQSGVDKGATDWDNSIDVPNIIVVPQTGFSPPDEQETITNDYPDFDDYYAGGSGSDGTIEVDSAYSDWYSP